MLDNLIKIETEYTKKFTLLEHTFAIGLPYIIHLIAHHVVSYGYIFLKHKLVQYAKYQESVPSPKNKRLLFFVASFCGTIKVNSVE